MKKSIIFGLRLAFYISALLFFNNDILIIPALLLISYLMLENKKYSFLPLILLIFLPLIYQIILVAAYLYHLILIKYIRKNRYYSFITYLISILTANIILLLNKDYSFITLYISIASIILYSIINMLYIYYQKGDNFYTISYNDKLINLTILLGYLLLITIYNPNPILYHFFFIQIFLVFEYIYNILFILISYFTYFIIYKNLNNDILIYFSSSFFPPLITFNLSFNRLYSYFFIIYSAIALSTKLNKKQAKIEDKAIANLINDFKNYLIDINQETEKLDTLKKLRETHLEYIQDEYCNKCTEDNICKYKLDKRYSFLCNAMNNENNNIYFCPHYDKFYFNNNIKHNIANKSYSAITIIADELEIIYNQNLKMARLYNKFINTLSFYGYIITDVDVNLKSSSLYISFTIDNEKTIVKELILKIAYKIFKEPLDIKLIKNKIYIFKKTKCKLEYAHSVFAKDKNYISGDNYYIKRDYNDSYIFALSDGMGSGHNAYLESAHTLKLLSNLFDYHFSYKATLSLLEDIYDIKCDYDSYATLDVLYVNTSNMKLNLYKLGSTTTYIYHNGDLISYENKTLPLKLDDLNSSYEIEFFKNDIILLLSDGISDFISKQELQYNINYNENPEGIINQIINKIKEKENNELKDDASLIVIKVI